MTACIGIKGGHTNQTVNAVFSSQVAVGVFPFNHNGSGLDTSLIPVLIVHNLIGKAVPLCPSGVYTVEHLCPFLGFGATCTGMDGENHVGAVILSRQKGLKPCFLHVLFQLCKALLQFRNQALILKLVAHFAKCHQVVPLLLTLFLAVHFAL